MNRNKDPIKNPNKPAAERRDSPRSPLNTKAIISLPGVNRVVSESAYLRNIGRKGFAFVTGQALIRGSLYHFDLKIRDSHITLIARLVHLRAENTYYICGVKIENLSFSQRSRLNRLLSSSFPELHKKFLVYSLLAGVGAFVILKYLFGAGIGVSIVVFLVVAIAFGVLLPY